MTNGTFLEITRKKDLDPKPPPPKKTRLCNKHLLSIMLIECFDSLPVIFEEAVCETQSCPLMMSERRMQETKQIFMKTVISIGGDLLEKMTNGVILLLYYTQ